MQFTADVRVPCLLAEALHVAHVTRSSLLLHLGRLWLWFAFQNVQQTSHAPHPGRCTRFDDVELLLYALLVGVLALCCGGFVRHIFIRIIVRVCIHAHEIHTNRVIRLVVRQKHIHPVDANLDLDFHFLFDDLL